MEYNRNCAGCRPYNHTCGMNQPCRNIRNSVRQSIQNPTDQKVEDKNREECLDRYPLAMAYVPCQRFSETFQLDYALNVGTIFPCLCKPFCGRRCLCR